MTSPTRKMLIALLLLFISQGSCQEDPCSPGVYEILPKLNERYRDNEIGNYTEAIEDEYLDPYAWYFTEGIQMLNQTPGGYNRCGTQFPIWLNGPHPETEGEEVQRMACTVTYDSVCAVALSIWIKKCPGNNYVYRLEPPTHSYSAYCFGVKNPVRPVIGDLTCDLAIKTRDNGDNYSGMYCECDFQLPVDVEQEHYYKVFYYMDATLIYESGYVLNSNIEDLQITEDTLYDSGFRLGKKLSCEIELFFETDGSPGYRSDRSAEQYQGMTIEDPNVVFKIGETDATKRTIRARRHTPIPCNHGLECTIQMTVSIPNTLGGIQCSSLGVANTACHIDILSTSSLDQDINITLGTQENGQYIQTAGHYQVFLSTVTLANRLWRNYPLPLVDVYVQPADATLNQHIGRRCESNNDPHMLTFDLKRYEFQLSGGHTDGVYTLYYHPEKDAEVQIMVKTCNGVALCNCGVAVRHGLDLFEMNVCDDSDLKINYKYCGDKLLRVKSEMSLKYKISLLYGTVIEADVQMCCGGKFLVVRVVPSPSDGSGKTKGLCGTLDRNTNNDFFNPQGSLVSSKDEFIESWRVIDESKNMFSENFDTDNLTPQTVQVCLCSSPTAQGKISCVQNAVAECNSGKDVSMENCPTPSRKKRSLDSNIEKPRVRYVKQPDVSRMKRQAQQWALPDAMNHCSAAMQSCPAYEMCTTLVPDSRPDNAFDDCVSDVMLTNGTDWTSANVETMRSVCMSEINRDISLWTPQGNGNGPSIAQQIKESTCMNDCSGHGQCNSGECGCETGFIGSDCSFVTGAPGLFGLLNNGLFDVANLVHPFVNLLGFPVIDTLNLKCRFKMFTISLAGIRVDKGVIFVQGRFNTLLEVICEFQALDIYALAMFSFGFLVSYTNDGINFSSEQEEVIYDPRCQVPEKKGGRINLSLKAGWCFIDGKCHFNGEICAQDSCQACNAASSRWSWTIISSCQGSKCIVRGDPHIMTFDNTKYMFGGVCPRFLLAYMASNPTFGITGDFHECVRPTVSCLKSTTLHIGGQSFQLGPGRKVYLNGGATPLELPFVHPPYVVFFKSGQKIVAVLLKSGASLTWDGRRKADIAVPISFFSSTYGMCGTFNHDKSDDFTKSDLTVTSDVNVFGDSWKTTECSV